MVTLAGQPSVARLCFESVLLVDDGSAMRLKTRLERLATNHDLAAAVAVGAPKPMGTLHTGFIRVLLARQRTLKPKRHVYHGQ